jgi:thymidylate synthase (FAD)
MGTINCPFAQCRTQECQSRTCPEKSRCPEKGREKESEEAVKAVELDEIDWTDETGPVPVLDHGFVRLDAAMADDLSVVNSARVSFGKRHEEVEESDRGLISFLMKHRHGTPFEHNAFRFHVKAPIFVFREWQRHRIGSFNEMSGRYMELPGEWYVPEPENVRIRVGKPGQYSYEPASKQDAEAFIATLQDDCEISYSSYLGALRLGIAPELARFFLHVNHFSEMYWTVNARSMMNFLSLRHAPTAQWEIQEYAMVIERFFGGLMPLTWNAFVISRVAP